ncbi:MAG: 2-oxoglutarate dehydrogenase complex dihydrolipoyllysine-residue succinyltransferase, partial [Sphingomonadales bacterium]
TLAEQIAKEGDTVEIGALIGKIAAGEAAAAPAPAQKAEAPAPALTAEPQDNMPMAPAARRIITDYDLDASQIKGTGKDGRITKGDVLAAIEAGTARKAKTAAGPTAQAAAVSDEPREERVRMTRLRQRIAERLKEAQNTAAMLTTFNEVDMSAVIEYRAKYKDMFEKKHGIKLGFMSFFVKAVVHALKEVPSVNAAIEGDEIVYKNFYDIGIAVSAPGGLVVPVVRNADKLSFAETELAIADYGRRARDGKLELSEMQGGTFTVTNGGIFGSLMSTPILNPPQSGILGMHKIQERPMAVKGQVEIRPMMYLAHSYDHRLIDGREAVTFLVRVKDMIEDPSRLLIDL